MVGPRGWDSGCLMDPRGEIGQIGAGTTPIPYPGMDARMAMTPTSQKDGGSGPQASVRRVNWPEDVEVVRGLFQEYRQWLADHQDTSKLAESRVRAGLALVDRLVADLPGAYGPPVGEVLLWRVEGHVVACGGLRELEAGVGEIKRIYVRPDHRGKEFGGPYVGALVDRARELGYRRLRVDTLPSMTAAIEFYQEAGFRPIASYWSHPVAGALFFEKEIGR